MKRILLSDNWTLSGGGLASPVAATVPGCVHTDLRAHGLIPDMYYRDNPKQLQWIENEDWTYTCRFEAARGKGAALLFEGLDTYADVYLNGVRIGEADDMFHPYSFPCGEALRDGENLLEVRFRSPVREVEDKPARVGAFTTERMNTRRMQCTYSWDWVERFVTAGVYRPVYLTYDNGIDIEDVYVYTENIDAYSAGVCTEIRFRSFGEGALCRVEITDPDGKVVGDTEFYADRELFVRRFDISAPRLWYPAGYGESPLYTLRVTVGENEYTEHFGIRTLKIVQLTDREDSEYHKLAEKMQDKPHAKTFALNERHSGFLVLVNGKPILCKGGNWVPCEPFPSAESDEKIERLVELAREMGVNTLRVWGGGLFEKRAFYDACDRLGILVIHDFLMACGEYPEKEQWFIDALRRESAFAVKYLRNHPSLAWWQGDNENATEGGDTQRDYTGRDSALSGIFENVYKYDRQRVFLPSSPYGGKNYGSITVGTTHTTNFLGRIFEYFDTQDCEDYKEYLGGFTARFISEEGTFGAICRPSMLKFMTEDDLIHDGGEEMLCYHTKGNPALSKEIFSYVTSFAKKALGEPSGGEDKFFKYKYAQYEWVRVAFENCKRNLGYCNGIVFWMFNDCWPAALGWSFVDYYCLPKASFYAFKRMAKPVTVSVTEEEGAYRAYVTGDSGTEVGFDLCASLIRLSDFAVERVDFNGGVVPGHGVTALTLPFAPRDGYMVRVSVVSKLGTDVSFYKRGALKLRRCERGVKVVGRTENTVTVEALEYVHALELEGQYIFEDNYFSMTAGERRTVSFREWDNADGADFTTVAYTVEE